jgi:hypothetical protein
MFNTNKKGLIMIITNLETKEYQGVKSYYANVGGERAKLKNFPDDEIFEGADLDGELKAWAYNGKTGFNFWKKEQEKASFGNVNQEIIAQMNAKLDEINGKLDIIYDIVKPEPTDDVPF